jgi:hypothetical protein
MRALQGFIGGVALAASLAVTASTANSAGLTEKIELQAAMQQHINQVLVDGAYLYLDRESGEVQSLYPITAHPKILRMGEHFVLCADFRNADGEAVNVDFYITPKADSFVVFHSAIDDRKVLKQLMSEGAAEPYK